MKNAYLKGSVGVAMVVASVFGLAVASFATDPPTAVSLATDSGTSFQTTGLAVLAALIPLAVILLVAKKALPWARQMFHI